VQSDLFDRHRRSLPPQRVGLLRSGVREASRPRIG
jgi:hypothetical protein